MAGIPVFLAELPVGALDQVVARFGLQMWVPSKASISECDCCDKKELDLVARARGACVWGVLGHRGHRQLFEYGVLKRNDTEVCKLRAFCAHRACRRWTPWVSVEPNVADSVTALVTSKLAASDE
jgi:hypothetical protein